MATISGRGKAFRERQHLPWSLVPAKILKAILGVDGTCLASLQGSGLSWCLAVPAPCIKEVLRAMGLQIRVFSSSRV